MRGQDPPVCKIQYCGPYAIADTGHNSDFHHLFSDFRNYVFWVGNLWSLWCGVGAGGVCVSKPGS